MSFLFPAFLFGALTIAIPIILHLTKRDVVPRVAFSDIRFLKRAPTMQARRRRLRELLLLALRVVALLLLVFAFARPFFDETGLLDRAVTIVALDGSFSMSFPGSFDRARAAARRAIDEAPPGHLVGVVTFDDRAAVAVEPSADRGAAVAGVNLATPGFGATRYAAGVDTAVELIGSREGRIVIVTDLQRSGWDADSSAVVPPGVVVDVSDVGPPGDNLAVTVIRPGPTGVAGVVSNSATTGRLTTASLRVGDIVLRAMELMLEPGSTDLAFDVELPPTGVLELAIDDPGGIAADDRRYYLLDPPPPVPIAVVTASGRLGAGAFYLERALLAGEETSAFSIRPLSPRAVANGAFNGLGAVLLIGTEGLDRPARRRLASFVEAGGGLLIVAGPTLDPALVADVLGPGATVGLVAVARESELSWSVTETRHPIFRGFGGHVGTLGQVRFRRTMLLEQTDTGRVLAGFSDGTAAMVEYTVGLGRALVFASDLNNEWNDFPRRPAFVPFVHEMTRYLVGRRDLPRKRTIADAPPGMDPVPGGTTEPEFARTIVLNVDPRESDPSRLTPEAFTSRITRSAMRTAAADVPRAAAARESEQGYWWYALLAMMVVLVAELWLGRTMA